MSDDRAEWFNFTLKEKVADTLHCLAPCTAGPKSFRNKNLEEVKLAKKTIILTREMSVGNVAAETDDEFLFKCFFDHPAKAAASDVRSVKSFLLGSTGCGKRAIIRKISQEADNASILELNELSMSYISNSNAIRFIQQLDIPLDYFFQALWRHIIIIEYIRLYFDVNSEEKSKLSFNRHREWFGNNEVKKRSIAYLERWNDKFWVSFDQNIREIEESLERSITAHLGGEFEKFKADAGYNNKLKGVKRSQIQQRLKGIVDSNLLSDLARLQDALSDYSKTNSQKNVIILIDGLDENWVGKEIKYKLIKALIESVKSLRKIHHLKIVSAIRSDLLEKVIEETRHDGFQSEKYADYFIYVHWSAGDLKELIEKRINFMFKSNYNSENIHFSDIFPDKIVKQRSFDFIQERTLLGPRDIIQFLNQCFSESTGKTPFPQQVIKKAERNYSEDRLRALTEEWASIFPGIEILLSLLIRKRPSFEAKELMNHSTIDDIALRYNINDTYNSDPLFFRINQAYEMGVPDDSASIAGIIVDALSVLHLTGAVGLNTAPNEPLHWFFKEGKKISKGAIGPSSKVRIHPMLHTALGISNFSTNE